MAATHDGHDLSNDGSWLNSAFALAACGTVAVASGIVSAPVALGAAAAVAGVGLLSKAVSSEGTGNVAMVAAMTAAVTSFVVGLPMEFVSEAVVFPWAHDTAFGAQTMEATGSVLVPFYNTIGTWFGIEPLGLPTGDVPVPDI